MSTLPEYRHSTDQSSTYESGDSSSIDIQISCDHLTPTLNNAPIDSHQEATDTTEIMIGLDTLLSDINICGTNHLPLLINTGTTDTILTRTTDRCRITINMHLMRIDMRIDINLFLVHVLRVWPDIVQQIASRSPHPATSTSMV